MPSICDRTRRRVELAGEFAQLIRDESSEIEPLDSQVVVATALRAIESALLVMVESCAVLAHKWRHLINVMADEIAAAKYFDLAEQRDWLLNHVDGLIRTYVTVEEQVASAKKYGITIPDGDLKLASREAANIKKWIQSFPALDTSRRDRIYAEILAGSPEADLTA